MKGRPGVAQERSFVGVRLWLALAITLVGLFLTWLVIYRASLLQAGGAIVFAVAAIALSGAVAWANGARG